MSYHNAYLCINANWCKFLSFWSCVKSVRKLHYYITFISNALFPDAYCKKVWLCSINSLGQIGLPLGTLAFHFFLIIGQGYYQAMPGIALNHYDILHLEKDPEQHLWHKYLFPFKGKHHFVPKHNFKSNSSIVNISYIFNFYTLFVLKCCFSTY